MSSISPKMKRLDWTTLYRFDGSEKCVPLMRLFLVEQTSFKHREILLEVLSRRGRRREEVRNTSEEDSLVVYCQVQNLWRRGSWSIEITFQTRATSQVPMWESSWTWNPWSASSGICCMYNRYLRQDLNWELICQIGEALSGTTRRLLSIRSGGNHTPQPWHS